MKYTGTFGNLQQKWGAASYFFKAVVDLLNRCFWLGDFSQVEQPYQAGGLYDWSPDQLHLDVHCHQASPTHLSSWEYPTLTCMHKTAVRSRVPKMSPRTNATLTSASKLSMIFWRTYASMRFTWAPMRISRRRVRRIAEVPSQRRNLAVPCGCKVGS